MTVRRAVGGFRLVVAAALFGLMLVLLALCVADVEQATPVMLGLICVVLACSTLVRLFDKDVGR